MPSPLRCAQHSSPPQAVPLLVGFAGAFRRSELVAIDTGHLSTSIKREGRGDAYGTAVHRIRCAADLGAILCARRPGEIALSVGHLQERLYMIIRLITCIDVPNKTTLIWIRPASEAGFLPVAIGFPLQEWPANRRTSRCRTRYRVVAKPSRETADGNAPFGGLGLGSLASADKDYREQSRREHQRSSRRI
jgi:hypothetical protein